jgi:putative transposase
MVLKYLGAIATMNIPKIKISKSFKYRLITDGDQNLTFSKWAGCCRYLYNWGLSARKDAWENNAKSLSYASQANQIKNLKKEIATEWLKEAPAQILQQSLKDLDQAYKNFFTRVKKGKVGKEAGFPKFKKKGRCVDAFRFPEPKQFIVEKLSAKKSYVVLPKIGKVKFFRSRDIVGRIRNCTLCREGRHWFISFNCEKEIKVVKNTGTSIGVDRGIIKTLATSEGKYCQLPIEKIKTLEKRKSILQKRGRKKDKFSKNWTKNIRAIAKLDRKSAKIRLNFHHQISYEMAKNHSYIVLEDLKVKNMSKSAKGTLDNPGTNVAAKSGLNRSILRQGWSTFQTLLEYKSLWYGSYVDYVDPKNTSRRCSTCGHTEKDNRLTQECFFCKKCGLELNADVNAAINILTQGHWGRACGDADNGVGSMKQEPPVVCENTIGIICL